MDIFNDRIDLKWLNLTLVLDSSFLIWASKIDAQNQYTDLKVSLD